MRALDVAADLAIRNDRSRFRSGFPVWFARAPGRLDVMGGVGDYSGSVVLEMPIDSATLAGIQPATDASLTVMSTIQGVESSTRHARIPMRLFEDTDGLNGPAILRQNLKSVGTESWVYYIAGCIQQALSAHLISPEVFRGLNVVVESDVPLGAGVSSSASLEVAVMTALLGSAGTSADPLLIAALCQAAENKVAGAPCGIMDQVTVTLGKQDHLLELLCRPHTILGQIPIPNEVCFIGIDSGVKHAVAGGAYTRARVGAFMGLGLLRQTFDRCLSHLTDLTVDQWQGMRGSIPETMTGDAFLATAVQYPDTVTHVDPLETYRVRNCVDHPIAENARVEQCRLLAPQLLSQSALIEFGQYMLAAHASYSDNIGLGADETDLLVELAMQLGPERGVYGAKITGGGSGGVVCVLCRREVAKEVVDWISQKYADSTGLAPWVSQGSSDGAAVVGVIELIA